jgi:Sulfotransferase domain
LIRDGRDVVDSRMHAVREGGWLAEQVEAQFKSDEERLRWAKGAMREWACGVDATTSAYQAHPERLRRMVRYEDLIGDTVSCIGSLFEWLGLRREPERVKRIVAAHSFTALPEARRGASKQRRAARPGLWRENLTDAEKAAAAEIMGSRLVELGYEE